MQTRWHVPPGLKIKEVKIEDRMKELHISGEKYGKIAAHLTRVSKVKAANEADELRRRRMKEESDSMTQHWPDAIRKETVIVVPTRSRQDVEDENLEKYLQVKKEQDSERAAYVDKMRRSLFLKKDFPKAITSALLFGEVLHEREKQLEIANVKKEQEVKERAKEYKQMLSNYERLQQEEDEKTAMARSKNARFAEELSKEVQKRRETRLRDETQRIHAELLEQRRAKLEMENIERIQQNKRKAKDKEDQEALVKFLHKKIQQQEAASAYDKDCQAVTDIIQKSKDRVDCLLRRKEREIIDERQKLMTSMPIIDKRKLEIEVVYDRAAVKRERAERRKQEEEEKKRKQARDDRIAYHQQHLQKREEDEKCEKNVKKLEMLERFRSVENQRKFHEKDKDVKQEKQNECREILLDQMKNPTLEEMVKSETEAAFKCMLENYAREDKMYLKYAEEAKEQCKELGWNPIALNKVVSTYRECNMQETASRDYERSDMGSDSSETLFSMSFNEKGTLCGDPQKECSDP